MFCLVFRAWVVFGWLGLPRSPHKELGRPLQGFKLQSCLACRLQRVRPGLGFRLEGIGLRA